MSRKYLYILVGTFFTIAVQSQSKTPSAFGPVPTKEQLKWQEMEYYAFVHLSVNTYTDMSWGFGNEDPKIFNPKDLDCRQWARIAKEAGMKAIILTAKHHSGFCLWPSKYTEYSVKNAPWKDGQGDIVREMADACKEYGLKLGIYLSPWDRNHPDYGKPEYITYFRNQLQELLTNYGEIFEVWFDGANGGDGYYGGANEIRRIDRKTYYDWKKTYKMVREWQPNIVIWNSNGDRADVRWVGTEAGYIGETNWSLLNAVGDETRDLLHYGLETGDSWVPGEVNTSIRPEWFYHQREDSKVKTLPQLMDTYYNSIGRNATLLLNFPITPAGLIHEKDEKAVLEFGKAIQEAFAENLAQNATIEASNTRANDPSFNAAMAIDGNKETYWATDEGVAKGSLTIQFDRLTKLNRFLAQEYISLGQRVQAFTLEAEINGVYQEIAKGTTIGYKRILRFPTVETTKLRFSITAAKSNFLISNVEVFNAPQILTPPQIVRKQSGNIQITPSDAESEVYYTLNGKNPTLLSEKYQQEIPTSAGKVVVKAMSYNPLTRKSSAIAQEEFDIAKTNWKILNTNSPEAYKVLDGDYYSVWHNAGEMPQELVIDLSKAENIVGFKYLPDQNLRSKGIITHYEFLVSHDNKVWQKLSSGEFANINNNPLWQTKTFKPQKVRFIKFKGMKNTKNDSFFGCAEIEIITK